MTYFQRILNRISKSGLNRQTIFLLAEIKQKRVLVSPLDWGLGHASRLIPIIRQLLKNGCDVQIAATGYSLNLLRTEFPSLKWTEITSYNIHYSAANSQLLSLLIQIPKIITVIFKEHFWLKNYIDKNNIDVIISDNRFGLWSKKIYSVYITHQLMVKMPKGLRFFEYPAHLVHKRIILKYDCCWIPDNETSDNLSGDLSHKYKLPRNAHFIGWLSRFSNASRQVNEPQDSFQIVCIVSGPEPQRAIFENMLYKQLADLPRKSLIIGGKPLTGKKYKLKAFCANHPVVVRHLPDDQMQLVIEHAEIVICRAGYSGIMDLVTIGKKAVLVPTPGQTEQEYLASYLKERKLFYSVPQDKLDVKHIT